MDKPITNPWPRGEPHQIVARQSVGRGGDDKVAGQVHLNVERQRLVTLLRFFFVQLEPGGRVQACWHVRELISGEEYKLMNRSIGREFNEMEALAWAAQ